MSNYWQRTKMPEFFNPWCLLSVALFAINNHYLKNTYHNWFTGKLSDFAACFFLPLFISAVVVLFANWPLKIRLIIGSVVTTTLFSAVKISPWASHWLSLVLSLLTTKAGIGDSSNIADMSDLIALPMVGVAYWFGLRQGKKRS